MNNPRQFEPKYQRLSSPRLPGEKVYRPTVGRGTRMVFRRATMALAYARRVHARWCRLYDAAVASAGESLHVKVQS